MVQLIDELRALLRLVPDLTLKFTDPGLNRQCSLLRFFLETGFNPHIKN